MASILSYLNGISSLIALTMAYLLAFSFIIKYMRQKQNLLLSTAILCFSLGSFNLGTVISFFSLLITGNNIDFILAGYLGMTCVPIAILNAMNLGFSIFKPESRKRVLIFFSITAIVYYIPIFFLPGQMFGGEIPPEIIPGETELADFAIKSIVLYLTVFYVICVIVILGGGFLKLVRQLTGKERKKAWWLLNTFVLFAIAATLDVWIPTIIIVLPRVLMIISYYSLYRGLYSDRASGSQALPQSL